MAEVDTYGFDLREVTTALIKQQGIHEGLWMLAFEFSLGLASLGLLKKRFGRWLSCKSTKFHSCDNPRFQPAIIS